MKNILDIYNQYNIMPNLQMHQLRVAAVAYRVCEAMDESINLDKDGMVKACLLHDMGNIIKFDLDYTEREFPEFFGDKDKEHWQSLKDEYIKNYGMSEHHATIQIAREIGINDTVIEYMDSIDSTKVKHHFEGSDFHKKICIYVDMRVGPHGVINLHERMLDAENRYKGRTGYAFTEELRTEFEENIKKIEDQIFSICKIKPEEINDESCEEIIQELKKYKI